MEFPKAETVRESIDKFKEETALKKRMEQEQLIRDAIEYMIENHHSSFCIDGIDFDDVERVTGWVDYLKQKLPELYIVKSTPYFCEISNPEAKKSCAVEFLSNYYGIKKEEILAIGDQNNDIELLKSGGVAVAMGNATDELKKHADFVTDTIDNNGFVKAIEKFVFQNGLKFS